MTPAAIIHWFLIQVLHGNTALTHVSLLAGRAFTASAFCQARARLPLAVFQTVLRAVVKVLVPATEVAGLWLGHRVLLIDGSSFSMPDVAALQAYFGQPGNQAKGCGFPVAHILALFHAGTGLLLEVFAAPLRSHDMAGVGGILPLLKRGDVLVADRGFCSFAHLALLICKGVHAVFRLHQKQIVDFTPGRAHARPGQKRAPKGMPRSRWVSACGLMDQVVEYFKPVRCPVWMSADEYRKLPESIMVRELRYRITAPGFRTREVTLVTTLLDAAAYPADALAELYGTRWRIEENSEVAEADDEDGCVEVHDSGWSAQGIDDVCPGIQPGAGDDVPGGGPSGCRSGSGQLHRRAEVAARCRGGGGDAGAGGQSTASGAVRAAGEEAASQAVPSDEEAAGRIAQAVEG